MRFVHAADIHLGSPLGGLDLHEDAPAQEIRRAPRRAFEALIDFCVAEQVDLLLIAGDLFDGRADLDTQLFVERQLRRLSEAHIRTVLLRGNHDATSKQALSMRLPALAHELSVDRAETLLLPEIGAAVHGRGFANQHVPESLVDEYPAAIPGLFNIGMLHTSASGTAKHEVYAPCTVAQLTGKGYDYWALGHVHQRTVLSESPPVLFSGNIQGRDIGETGAKGATLVTVDDGVIVEAPQHVDFDVVRWHRINLDATDAQDGDALLAQLETQIARTIAAGQNGDLEHAVRITVTGTTPLHRELADHSAGWADRCKQVVAAAGQDRVWVERIRMRTEPPLTASIGSLREREDMVGELARDLEELTVRGTLSPELTASLAQLSAKIPTELLEGEDAIALVGITPGGDVAALLTHLETDLLSRLVSVEALAAGEGEGGAA